MYRSDPRRVRSRYETNITAAERRHPDLALYQAFSGFYRPIIVHRGTVDRHHRCTVTFLRCNTVRKNINLNKVAAYQDALVDEPFGLSPRFGYTLPREQVRFEAGDPYAE